MEPASLSRVSLRAGGARERGGQERLEGDGGGGAGSGPGGEALTAREGSAGSRGVAGAERGAGRSGRCAWLQPCGCGVRWAAPCRGSKEGSVRFIN